MPPKQAKQRRKQLWLDMLGVRASKRRSLPVFESEAGSRTSRSLTPGSTGEHPEWEAESEGSVSSIGQSGLKKYGKLPGSRY